MTFYQYNKFLINSIGPEDHAALVKVLLYMFHHPNKINIDDPLSRYKILLDLDLSPSSFESAIDTGICKELIDVDAESFASLSRFGHTFAYSHLPNSNSFEEESNGKNIN